MSFAGKLALGIARGAAGYYGKVAEQEMEQRKIDLLAKREMALSVFNSGLRRDEAAITAEEQRKSYTHKVAADVAGEAALLPKKTQAQIDADAAREAARLRTDTTKIQIEHDNRITLEKLTSKLDMDEARQEAALRLSNDLALLGKKADRYEITSDGAMVAFNAEGKVLSKTPKNVFPVPSRGSKNPVDAIFDSDSTTTTTSSGNGNGQRATLTVKPPAWKTYEASARDLLGRNATQAQVEAKAKELAEKYKAG